MFMKVSSHQKFVAAANDTIDKLDAQRAELQRQLSARNYEISQLKTELADHESREAEARGAILRAKHAEAEVKKLHNILAGIRNAANDYLATGKSGVNPKQRAEAKQQLITALSLI